MNMLRSKMLPAIVLYLVLFPATFKPVVVWFEGVGYSLEIKTSPTIFLIEANSYLLLPLFAAITLFHLLLMRRWNFSFLPISSIMVIMSLYMAVRSIIENINDGAKFGLQAILYALILLYLSILTSSKICHVKQCLFSAALWISITIVILNMYNFVGGFGFIENVPRYFGTTNHPNFMGVQLAVAAVSIYANMDFKPRLNWDGIKFILLSVCLFCCAFLLYNTGSRTGLLVAFAGLAAFVVSTRQSVQIVIGCLVVLAVGAYRLMFDSLADVSMDVYDRGGENTRYEAWNTMYNEIMESPVFGSGHFPSFSENSYLRGWAAFGVFFFISMIIVEAIILVTSSLSVIKKHCDKDDALVYALSISLVLGSVLEGFLLDAFSLPGVINFCLAATLDSVMRERRSQKSYYERHAFIPRACS